MQGAGIGGSNATCIELGPKAGGLTFASRKAAQSGYQPFGQASAVEFWLKDKNGSSTIPDVTVSSNASLLLSSSRLETWWLRNTATTHLEIAVPMIFRVT